MDDLLESDLSDADVDRLVRLIRAFTEDIDYDLRPQHVRERWTVLRREDAELARWLLGPR